LAHANTHSNTKQIDEERADLKDIESRLEVPSFLIDYLNNFVNYLLHHHQYGEKCQVGFPTFLVATLKHILVMDRNKK